MSYSIEEILYQQSGITIYRARDKEQSFIVKSASAELPSAAEIEALKNEYETIRRLFRS